LEFRLDGHGLTKPRLYDVCGLPGVYLLNGYEVIRRGGEEYVAVTDVSGLHRAISKHVVLTHKVLTPKEVRFIRKTLDFTQSEMAAKLGVTVQSVARWEKGQCEMPGAADKLLRAVYLAQHLSEDEDLKTLQRLLTTVLDDLDKIDEGASAQASFRLEETWTEVRVRKAA
jgi:putative zinc finger/helix-turn-helix YgiT family protein